MKKHIKNLEAILFDMDGVLVDVSSSYRIVIKKTAEYFLKEEVSHLEVARYKLKGGYNNDWDLTEAIIQAHHKSVPKKKIINEFQKLYIGDNFNGLIQNEKWLLDSDILESLNVNFKLGIITGRPRQEAEFALEKNQVVDYFDTLICMEDTPEGKGKPNPFGILLAMEKLAVKRALYLGDTIDDMKAAKAANIIPIGVINNGDHENINLLQENGARLILNHVNDIQEILQ
jgi:HAD superfamily hydrolase (TIGR01548 family)